MGTLDAVRERITSLRENLAESVGTQNEEILEDYAHKFWRDELRETVQDGEWERAERELQDFLERVRNGQFDSIKWNTLSPSTKSPALEAEMEEVKELVFLQMLQWERNLLENRDRAIFRGDESDHAMFPGDALKHQDEPLFVLEEGEGTYEVRGTRVERDSTFVTLSFARRQLESTRKHLEAFKFGLKLAEDVEVPQEELEIAEDYKDAMQERVELLETAVEKLENDQPEEAER
ncbi:MAG: hypothetical protein ABEI58_01505, partial [Candidatus Nanohaloarchaea archaeon]